MSRPRLILACAALVAALYALPAAAFTPGKARVQLADPLPAVASNPANALASTPIEDPVYEPATRCRNKRQPGMTALVGWLTGNSRGASWGSYRCELWGKNEASLHSENRALDWHLDVQNPADRAAAQRLIELLLAPDSAGNPQALARRMGIEEIIWNCSYWGAGMAEFSRYNYCYSKRGKLKKRINPTQAHEDHIHIGMTRAGAAGKTSFWLAEAKVSARSR